MPITHYTLLQHALTPLLLDKHSALAAFNLLCVQCMYSRGETRGVGGKARKPPQLLKHQLQRIL